MPSFRTNFHATLDELIDLVGQWINAHPIVATAQLYPPSRLIPLSIENYREVLMEPLTGEIMFTEGPITKPAKSTSQALGEHPNGLILTIERLGPAGLPQSSLATMHTTPLWSKLNREIKKRAPAGANCIWNDGHTTFDRNARCTEGAKALAASGVRLREHTHSMRFHYLPK